MRRLLALVPALFLAACVTQNDPPPNQGGYPPGQGGYQPPPPPPPPGPEAQAPVVVTLQQGNVNASTGETDVIVWIDVTQPLAYPTTLTVTPPAGGQLTAGMPQETLQLGQQGRLQRVYRVRTSGPLGPSNAVHVVLHGESGAMGVHADRWLPPPAEMRVPPHQGPTPPTGRPPSAAPPGMQPPAPH